MSTTMPRERLAATIRARRVELGKSVSAMARLAGLDRDTWSDLERGVRDATEQTHAAAERALGWRAGSVRRVLDGGAPEVETDDVPDVDAHAVVRQIREILVSRFSADTKIGMISDVIRDDYDALIRSGG